MAGGCKAAIGCVDARVPVRASYVSLYKWPESDAEFVRSVAMARRQGEAASPSVVQHYHGGGSMRCAGAGEGYCSPRVVDSYSCRQIYLRSYTFVKKKETVPERTMACLGRVRERGAAVFPFLPQRAGSDAGSFNSASSISREAADAGRRGGSTNNGTRRRRRKKKGCAMARKLQETSCGAVRALFHRLLACTTSVDVADGGEPPSR
ncbi:hypothetical protein GUJ93_ZPchr0005g16035 [Zizania palustris]|uniref:Uncharacterized protein n=1 Tax=Zizania palustris TaxID=103762 RepID=A0A8J5VGX9_ZIZPA|nr:hypothetical protein GUJ93_ZPchr0005g16035 [Zizania palustris]